MIPYALKPAICLTCKGSGNVGPSYGDCPSCGGSGINPDMIKVSSGAGRFAGIGEYIPEGRYVVIPLEDTQ